MLDFAALPPEVNSGLMYTGPGAGPMLAAATAWDVLATELYSTALAYGSVITDLTGVWLGPSSIMMAAAATPFVSWISATAGLVEATGMQAKAAVAAYEAAFAMTVPPPVIAANRALLMALVATNFFGQNTPAIMATEAQYAEMWAQDAAAMYGYQAAAQTASTFTPMTAPPTTTATSGVSAQTDAAAQAAQIPAGTAAQTVSPLTSAVSTPVSSAVTAPVSSAVTAPVSSAVTAPVTSAVTAPVTSAVTAPLGSAVTAPLSSVVTAPLSSAVSTPLSSAVTAPLSSAVSTPLSSAVSAPLSSAVSAPLSSAVSAAPLSSSLSWTTSSTALTSSTSSLVSGTGSAVSMSTSGISATGSMGPLMQSVGPTGSVFGNHFQAVGYALGHGFSPGTGVFAAPDMGSVTMTANVGRAAILGSLSVPQSWASAAPALSQVGSALPITSASATPAVMAGGPGGTPSGMPMLPNSNAARSTGSPMPPRLRIGFRPTMVPDPVYVG